MKKKQIAQLGVTLGLVAAVGVGGTLAILSAQSNVVTNTFAAGAGIDETKDLTVFESDNEYNSDKNGVQNTFRDDSTTPDGKLIDINGIAYGGLEPNLTIPKDPAVEIAADTADCYLFVKIDGVETLKTQVGDGNLTIDGVYAPNGNATAHWVKVVDESIEGDIYYYATSSKDTEGKVIDTSEERFISENLFNNITFGIDAQLYDENGAAKEGLSQISVKAFIVQATEAGNWTEALNMAKEQDSWE